MAKHADIIFIPLKCNYKATHQEITRVRKLISERPTITTRQIAALIDTSPNRVHYMIQYLKQLGHISRSSKRQAYTVLRTYVEL